MPFSENLKICMIERFTCPNAQSAMMLSREFGVPQPMLLLRRARRSRSTSNWSPVEQVGLNPQVRAAVENAA